MRPDETRALVDQYDRLAVKTQEQRGTQDEKDTIQQLRTEAIQLDKASHFRFADPQKAVERHPDLAGSYGMLRAMQAHAEAAGFTAEQALTIVESSRQNIAASIQRGDKLLSVEITEARSQDRNPDVGLAR